MKKRPILIVEDDPEARSLLVEGLSHNGYAISLAENGERALQLIETHPFELVITDLRLPGMSGLDLLEALKGKAVSLPVIVVTGFGTIQGAVEAMKKGAYDYLLKPFSFETLEQVIQNALREREKGFGLAIGQVPSPDTFRDPILTQSGRMKEILALCQRIAPTKATVLVQGESGTGKELLARYIHAQSDRREGPFVPVNCAALPEQLLESELFGHEKGSFTGAIQRKMGKFELAHRGTILLDEISEMNPPLQAKLLRVLQENEIDRVGGSRPIPVDIRVIATTNRKLEESVQKGEFREDLYYRLNVIAITLPPLRERKEDIELLARHFVERYRIQYGRSIEGIAASAVAWLKDQPWRGNVRELKNLMERAVLTTTQAFITEQDLSAEDFSARARQTTEGEGASLCLKEMERRLIFRALEQTQGNRTHAAKVLGISIRTLRNKLSEYRKGLSSPILSERDSEPL